MSILEVKHEIIHKIVELQDVEDAVRVYIESVLIEQMKGEIIKLKEPILIRNYRVYNYNGKGIVAIDKKSNMVYFNDLSLNEIKKVIEDIEVF